VADSVHILPRLRQHTAGVLAFGESIGDVTEACKFILDPATGEPVLPVAAEALRGDEVMLYLPDDGIDNPECLQLHAAAHELNPDREPAADRWLAYHQRPTHARWARLHVQSIKRLDDVVDGDLVRLANPLARDEGKLCKAFNHDRAALANAAHRIAGIHVDDPLLVGVDPWGCDVRHRFGVLRLEFAQPASITSEALGALGAIFGKLPDFR
jgi:hypothetical protein